VLYLALAAVVFLAVVVGLAMCRLAARSDRLQAIALAEWAVASSQRTRRDSSSQHQPVEARLSAYRKAS
jgi:hypothetical protein